MSTSSPLAPRAWLIVGLLWVVGCLNYLDRIMLTTMRGSLMEAIPMSDAQFGILTSVFLWVYGLLSAFAGFLADRFNRSRVIIISLFVWSAITWLTAHATTFNELLLTRALMGISEACYIPAALALIVDYHRDRTRSLAVGLHLSGVLAGSALGGLGGWIAEGHGWAYAFEIFGVVGIVYAFVLVALLRDAPRDGLPATPATTAPEKVRVGAALVSLFSRPMFVLALCYWGLLGAAGWGVVGWMPTYLTEHFHLTQGAGGLSATGYLQTAAMVGMLVGGAWADRWSRTNERARILVPVIGLVIAAPGILLAAHTGWLPAAIGGLMIYGLARSFTDANMMPILCLVSDPRYRATGYGVLNMFACVVGGITIYVGGALRDARVDVNNIFYFAFAALIVCAVLLSFVKPQPDAKP
jgi:MFS family permease